MADRISPPAFHHLWRHMDLCALVQRAYIYTDKFVVSAFVERWQPVTYTFHMPFGGMTITLDYVSCLTGMAVSGLHVSLKGHAEGLPHELVALAFELSETAAKLSLAKSDGTTVTIEWLCISFRDLPDVLTTVCSEPPLGLTFYTFSDALSSLTNHVRRFLFITCISLWTWIRFVLIRGVQQFCASCISSWVQHLEPVHLRCVDSLLCSSLDFWALPMVETHFEEDKLRW